jgi:hypothetical protein
MNKLTQIENAQKIDNNICWRKKQTEEHKRE